MILIDLFLRVNADNPVLYVREGFAQTFAELKEENVRIIEDVISEYKTISNE